jgi:hypothetical protein
MWLDGLNVLKNISRYTSMICVHYFRNWFLWKTNIVVARKKMPLSKYLVVLDKLSEVRRAFLQEARVRMRVRTGD